MSEWANTAYKGPTPSRGFRIPRGAVRDPHHGGYCQWRYHDKKLWHRDVGQSKWTEVKRVSFTRDRILAIADMIRETEATGADR